MFTTSLRKVGGSVMLAVPPPLLEMLGLHPGAKVGVSIEGGKLLVQPQTRPKYTLEEILSQCDSKAKRSNNDSKWLRGKRVGRELI